MKNTETTWEFSVSLDLQCIAAVYVGVKYNLDLFYKSTDDISSNFKIIMLFYVIINTLIQY